MNNLGYLMELNRKYGLFKLNRRKMMLIIGIACVLILIAIIVASSILDDEKILTHLDARNLSPSIQHIFGTDGLGRDMFVRTIKGLSLSIGVGIIGATVSVVIALICGTAAATMGRYVDRTISWFVDLFLGIPQILILIFISFILGGGLKGVIIGIACTHWTGLTRVIRAEILQLRAANFVSISKQLGRGGWWITIQHIFPHVFPQLLVGIILLFPHAIIYEASITFLGFGLSPHQPSIGAILSESMQYISQNLWWLAFFPGITLLIVVRIFDAIGENLRLMLDPSSAHE